MVRFHRTSLYLEGPSLKFQQIDNIKARTGLNQLLSLRTLRPVLNAEPLKLASLLIDSVQSMLSILSALHLCVVNLVNPTPLYSPVSLLRSLGNH